ncbi:hypothetical protein NDU88_004361 [Pleurodeles waltl]|uniref:Secreted protein n=1 Tax=Pleurodeles waltl TaxID=8319 RepID=A0AAV7MBH4_PLEWA|nr:hypothetical protein NDU88_004361 [Pleurodeles waltl]
MPLEFSIAHCILGVLLKPRGATKMSYRLALFGLVLTMHCVTIRGCSPMHRRHGNGFWSAGIERSRREEVAGSMHRHICGAGLRHMGGDVE